jgi:ABC-2 type transport system permease protein
MSSALRNVWLIARREYLERVRAKSFLIMTVLIPALMGGAIFGISLMDRNIGSAQHIAVITVDRHFAGDLKYELVNNADKSKMTTVDVYSASDPDVRETLDAQLKAKGSDLDGYLVVKPPVANERPTFEWVPKVRSDVITRARVASAARNAYAREQLTQLGMPRPEIDKLFQPLDLSESGQGKTDSGGAAVASAYGMYFLMYFVILFYGMNVARSIIEEKTSRVFEVLLATIRPTEMLAGKVIGVGAVGLSQIGIWIALATAAALLSPIGQELHILPTAPQAALFVVFFLLGFLLYSSIAAALGAMTNSEQELQQMQIFLMLPLIVSSLVIFNVITSPDGAISKGFSFFPFTTPLIMYTRVIVGKPGAWAVAGSILELMVTIAIVLWLASRIYRVGILMYGKKPNLPEILRWLKYS